MRIMFSYTQHNHCYIIRLAALMYPALRLGPIPTFTFMPEDRPNVSDKTIKNNRNKKNNKDKSKKLHQFLHAPAAAIANSEGLI